MKEKAYKTENVAIPKNLTKPNRNQEATEEEKNHAMSKTYTYTHWKLIYQKNLNPTR